MTSSQLSTSMARKLLHGRITFFLLELKRDNELKLLIVKKNTLLFTILKQLCMLAEESISNKLEINALNIS